MALTSIQDLRDRPIWGVGWGNFEHFGRLYSNADSPMVIYRHPHNIALEFAAQGGIVGAILLFVAILISSCLIRRAITRDLRLLFLSGACLFLAVGTLFAGDLFDFRLYWFAVLLVVMGSSSLPASQKRAQNSQEINRLDAAMTLDKGPIPQSDRL
jgi:O-antigen ligase